MEIIIKMPIKPVAWQRAGKSGKRHYTPAETANFEKMVKLYGKEDKIRISIEDFESEAKNERRRP